MRSSPTTRPGNQAARVFIGLGGNVGPVAAAFDAVCAQLAERFGGLHRSALYRAEPIGGPPQPAYLNAVVELRTLLAPRSLLRCCQALEAAHGRRREREVRWGPRPLDLDLLLYDELRLAEPDLVLPHPRLADRAFVLIPLAELDRHLVVPGLGPIEELLGRLPAGQRVERLDLATVCP